MNKPDGRRVGRGVWRAIRLKPVVWCRLWAAVVAACAVVSARGALQFDVFYGYGGQPTGSDGVLREAGWSSLGCELLNDGPSFTGTIEISGGSSAQGEVQRFRLELPTNTRKRFVLPVYGSGGRVGASARLVDERGRERARVEGMRPRLVAQGGFLMGAVPRTFAGAPRLPVLPGDNVQPGMQPAVARLPVEFVPDTVLAFEGLDALYLSSEKALELREPQVQALVGWVRSGGHVVLAVEQPADVNATPWLRTLLPCTIGPTATRRMRGELEDWLRLGLAARASMAVDGAEEGLGSVGRLRAYCPDGVPGDESRPELARQILAAARDAAVAEVQVEVASARLREGGDVVLGLGDAPLVVTGREQRGRVTVLLFSPEREPFRSWTNREWFWARLMRFPSQWFSGLRSYGSGGMSSDGVVGCMIDSRQVRKLPVGWLLLLLVLYLAVIGPLDRWVLRRLNRPMLTWVTFPGYVVLFSLLIYYIGYRLRAGETEWNELHVVDIVPQGQGVGALLRGETFASLYSPVNARYPLRSGVGGASVRSEWRGPFGMSREGTRLEVLHEDDGFRAQVQVPVWTSQMVVSDWVETGEAPLEVRLGGEGEAVEVTVRSRLPVACEDVRFVWRGQVVFLGRVEPGQERTLPVTGAGLREVKEVLMESQRADFVRTLQARQAAFGSSQTAMLELGARNLMGASLLGLWEPEVAAGGTGYAERLIATRGLDVSRHVVRGDGLLLAWVPGHAAVPSLRQFEAQRTSQAAFYRVVVPADSGSRESAESVRQSESARTP